MLVTSILGFTFPIPILLAIELAVHIPFAARIPLKVSEMTDMSILFTETLFSTTLPFLF